MCHLVCQAFFKTVKSLTQTVINVGRAVFRSFSRPDTPPPPPPSCSVDQTVSAVIRYFSHSLSIQFIISVTLLVSHSASKSVRQIVNKSPSWSHTTGYLHSFSQSVTQSIHQFARLSQSVSNSVNSQTNSQIFYLMCLYFYWLPNCAKRWGAGSGIQLVRIATSVCIPPKWAHFLSSRIRYQNTMTFLCFSYLFL